MKVRTDYKICPLCGASLDVGEKCDCQQEEKPMYNKVSICVYPYKYGCKGCEYNGVPEVYDGGCMLLNNHTQKRPKIERNGRQAYKTTPKKKNAV